MVVYTHKRIVVACDGTWVSSDNGFERDSWLPWKTGGHLANQTNVTKICRALPSRSREKIQQLVYYQGGIGSQNNFWSFAGGFTGEGISENIREAYSFICNNYEDGDEIILIGFSRGAFTARSIAGLIASLGLLTKHGLGSFYPIFKDWEFQANSKYVPQFGTQSWPLEEKDKNWKRPSFKSPAYMKELVKRGLTRPDIPIKAVGVWDTAGALGVPTMKLFGFPLHTDTVHEFSFINTTVSPNIEYAYQALAIDEKRTPFSPPLWELPEPGTSKLKLLKQTWFPGVHSSIGGRYSDTSISDITLAWMMTQLSRHLTFDEDYIHRQRLQNIEYYKSDKSEVAPWAMGLIPESSAGFVNTLAGRTVRTPGEYHPTDPDTGKELPRKLKNTHEFIHASVRYRMEQHGPGPAKDEVSKIGVGKYSPPALAGWRFVKPGQQLDNDLGGKEWEEYGRWVIERPDGSKTFIVEEKIENSTTEMDLLLGWEEYGVNVKSKLYPKLVDV